MTARKTGKRVSTRLFNWLENLDREAETLPRATNWIEPYGPFMLSRYLNLRPLPISGNIHSQIKCESGEKTAAQLFAEWESRIAESTEADVCLNGLGAEQRKQLAALVLQTIVDMQMSAAYRRSSQWAQYVRNEAPARLRELNSRLKKARRAVEKLEAYARDSEAESPNEFTRHSARLLIGFEYRLAADKALKALAIKCLPNAQELGEIANEHPTPERDVAFGMVQLYWFFRHECSLSGDESEVRTARLRNVFWIENGVSKVYYRAQYVPGESKGCEAVHIAVTRFRLNQGYKPFENSA